MVALEEELLSRIKQQGLNAKPQILVVSAITSVRSFVAIDAQFAKCFSVLGCKVTRQIPDAKGTKCNQELEPILNTKHSHILRVPFRTEDGVLNPWVSRFDIYPYLERFTQVSGFAYHLNNTLCKDVVC